MDGSIFWEEGALCTEDKKVDKCYSILQMYNV